MGRIKNRCNIVSIDDYDTDSDVIYINLSVDLKLLYDDIHDNNSGLIEKIRINYKQPFIKMYGVEKKFSNYYIFGSYKFIHTYHKDFRMTLELHGNDRINRWCNYPKGKEKYILPFVDEFKKGDIGILSMMNEKFPYTDNKLDNNSIAFSNSYNIETIDNNNKIKLYIPHDICAHIKGSSYRAYRLKKLKLID